MPALFLRPIPATAALPIGFLIGVVYSLSFLGFAFADPASSFWRLPAGYSGGLIDSRQAVSGFFWFMQDTWHWPLLHVSQPNPPQGASAVLLDSVPLLIIPMRAARFLIGEPNPYGLWVIACFGLNAAALAALVRGMGHQSLPATVAAAGLGALMPLVHLRFGHLGLTAQWTIVLPLAIYAFHARGRLSSGAAAAWLVALCAVAFVTAIYLYVMAAAVASAFMVQATLDRRLRPAAAALGIVLILAAGAMPMWAFGLIGNGAVATESVSFGYASMNLLSPFWPQSSGLFAWTGVYALTRGVIGATGGQYEGYAYLGGGTLVLLFATLARPGRASRLLAALARTHPVLLGALLVLTLWAVSDKVYLGDRLLLSYPMPEVLLHSILAWFRASGRFFWPVAWLLTALGVAGVLATYRPRVALPLLAAALVVQWIDLGTWRGRLHALTSGPIVSAFGSLEASAAVETEIGRLGAARVVPALACTAQPGDYDAVATIAGMEMQLLAARQNARTPSIVTARTVVDCATERRTSLPDLVGGGVVLVLSQPEALDRRAEARAVLSCRETLPGLLCTSR